MTTKAMSLEASNHTTDPKTKRSHKSKPEQSRRSGLTKPRSSSHSEPSDQNDDHHLHKRQDLRDAIRHFAKEEIDTLALKTLQLAKRGHTQALAFVIESLTEQKSNRGASLLATLGSITRLDEIADAERTVVLAAAQGEITPHAAVQYMKMLNELGFAIKNSDLQQEVDTIRSYIDEA